MVYFFKLVKTLKSYSPPRKTGSWLVALGTTLLLMSGATPLHAQQQQALPALPALGAAAEYGLLSGGAVQCPTATRVLGKVGAAQSLSNTFTANGGTFVNGSGTVAAALADARAAQAACNSRAGQIALVSLNGQALAAGTYSLTGNVALDAAATLTLTGDTSAVYVFNISGDLSLQTNAEVALGRVRPGRVYWNVGGNLRSAAHAELAGIALVGGSITSLGDWYGTRALLAGGNVQLAPYR